MAVGLGRIFIYVRIGLDGFWSVLVGVLGRGGWFGSNFYIRYVRAGLDGFGRFGSVVADNLGRIFTYVDAGLDGFERFSALLDAIF